MKPVRPLWSRRRFLAAASALAASAPGLAAQVSTRSARVLVIGGGAGGARAAGYLARLAPGLEITLMEPRAGYHALSMSNAVLGGARDPETLRFGYQGLAARGVTHVPERAAAIDTAGRVVTGAGGARYAYDRLLLAPGVRLRGGAIEGFAAGEPPPHAWLDGREAGALRARLEAMREGGVMIIGVPPQPYRDHLAAYERAAQAAALLSGRNPGAKVLVLDANPDFERRKVFEAAWKQLYGAVIERVEAAVSRVDTAAGQVVAGGETFSGDVLNVIPPQAAGEIAAAAGLADDSGWCPVDYRTLESTLAPGVHVLGDAAAGFPKSAQMANSQAKACAHALLASLAGEAPPEPRYLDVRYSLLGPGFALGRAAVYAVRPGGAGLDAVTPAGDTDLPGPERAARQAAYARSWFNNINRETFG